MKKDLIEFQRVLLNNLLKETSREKIQEVDENFKIIYTYDAVSMEGKNKIPYEEVNNLLKLKKIDNFSERDQKEILNHYESFNLVLEWIDNGVELQEELLKDLHEMLVKDIFQGGLYRNVNIQIYGATHQPPDYVKVYDRMSRYFINLDNFTGNLFEKAVYAHAELSKIHPFLDGNGRLARLVMNYYLLKDGHLPISIPLSVRDEYFKNLEYFKVEKDITPLENFIKGLLLKRYEDVVETLEI